MTNYLKFTEEELAKAEKVLRESGVKFESDVDLSSEYAVREVDYYFDNYPEDIENMHKTYFPDMEYDDFAKHLREDVLHTIVNCDTGFFPDMEAVESEIYDVVTSESFLCDFRKIAV